MVDLSQFKVWTAEEFEATFPPPGPNCAGVGTSAWSQGTAGGAGCAGDINESTLPDDLLEWIRDGIPDGERSDVFFDVVRSLKQLGYTLDGIFKLLDRHPNGIARKYKEGTDRLRGETERVYNKLKNGKRVRKVASAKTPPAPEPESAPGASAPAAPAPTPVGPRSSPASTTSVPISLAILTSPLPQLLKDTQATFRKWLGEKYDTDVLDITASAGAAERLGGDPLWLMLISGSGNAKTETVRSLEGAGALVTSTIASEGALLSATARSLGATGGLLHKIGSPRLLVIKDFTSILAMDSKVRGTVLAALREVHDGKWERNVGFAGGRTLTWVGRIVIVAACTTAWDEARKAVEAMGDRFVLVRADSTIGREESALKAIENTGREDAMRADLAKAMGSLVAGADMNLRQLSDIEKGQLVRLANVVTWARSGVERDFKGAVINAHAPEMPTRFAKQLAQVARGALSLGMPAELAMRRAIRCARDSLEPLRRDLLLDVASHPDTNPDDVHKRIVRPLTTVKNNLVALHTLRLLTCDEREEWRGNRVFSIPYYSLVPLLDQATLLSM
jgi:hypothetical protein